MYEYVCVVCDISEAKVSIPGACIGMTTIRNGTIKFHVTGRNVKVLQKVHKTALRKWDLRSI